MTMASGDPALLSPAGVRRAALSGLCASLVGIGLARFAYTPLLPALITGHWFTQSAAAYLGAANLAGYLAGAILGRAMTRWTSSAWLLRLLMLLTAISLFACALRDFGVVWFFVWRFISGYTGGAIMVLAAPTVLARTPTARRGLVGGAVFTGVGLGVAAAGTLVPFLLGVAGLEGVWVGLGVLALLLTFIGWAGWPSETAAMSIDRPESSAAKLASSVIALLLEYGLNAVGLVPHMLFFVVYIARGLGRGLDVGAAYWVLYGVGATIGPVLAGHLADRIGFRPALRLAFLIQAVAIALPVIASDPASLVISSLVVGAFTPGIVPLALGRVHELTLGHVAQRRVWSYATTGFALAQALAAYGCSYLLDLVGSYALLFSLGVLAVAIALVTDVALAVVSRPRRWGGAKPADSTV